MKPRLGLIVNPIAGIGGKAALKGSDAPELVARARAEGLTAPAPERATAALTVVRANVDDLELLAAPSEMGEDEARSARFRPEVVGSTVSGATRAQDTRDTAAEMVERGVDLLLFAGGDGTAVDVLAAVGDRQTVLGIPAGVKMHSAVFGVNPRASGELAARYLRGQVADSAEAEVMDTDEAGLRQGRISPRLWGYLRVPVERSLVQSGKARSARAERVSQEAIARHVVDRVAAAGRCVLGPGTSTRAIARLLGLEKTLMGVDVVQDGVLVAADAGERTLLEIVSDGATTVVVSPIGGQGFLFGRGNQQLSADVLGLVGRENIVIVATEAKLAALEGRPLLVDTGDDDVDAMLVGYARVVTGYDREVVYRIASS